MSGAPPRGRVPDLFLERTFSGEASAEERARVEADPDARMRLDDVMRGNTRFHMNHDPDTVLRAIEARAKEASVREALAPKSSNWWPVLLVGAPLAALALLLVQAPSLPDAGTPPEQTTAKGLKARLRVSQNTPRGVERVSMDEVLFAGDEVQVLTVAGDATHGVVVSIDGRGQVTRHFPLKGEDTTLPPGQRPLGEALELDDAPDFERFVLVSGTSAIDVSAVEAAARRTATGNDPGKAPLGLPAGLDQFSFVIRKGQK
jgi:hypothetical protein